MCDLKGCGQFAEMYGPETKVRFRPVFSVTEPSVEVDVTAGVRGQGCGCKGSLDRDTRGNGAPECARSAVSTRRSIPLCSVSGLTA